MSNVKILCGVCVEYMHPAFDQEIELRVVLEQSKYDELFNEEGLLDLGWDLLYHDVRNAVLAELDELIAEQYPRSVSYQLQHCYLQSLDTKIPAKK